MPEALIVDPPFKDKKSSCPLNLYVPDKFSPIKWLVPDVVVDLITPIEVCGGVTETAELII